MATNLPERALELRSLVTSHGTLELSLHEVPVPTPAANEVLVRVEASPINPSDLGLLIAGADMTTATVAGTPERPVVTAPLGAGALAALSARVDKSLPVGNEGAGTVVAAGSSPAAQALVGRMVGIAGGAMYTQYRAVDAAGVSGLARGDHGQGWGVVLRQSVDGARNAGNHAPRGPFGSGAHGGRVESWPDAGQALPEGRCAAGQYRPQARAGGAVAVDRRGARLQFGHRRRSRPISSKHSRRHRRHLPSMPPAGERWRARS